MIVKKKAEEIERKKAYTKRVLELLYPEEHATTSGHGSNPSTSSLSPDGAADGKESRGTQSISGPTKVYGAHIPPEILENSQLASPPSYIGSESSDDDDDDDHATGDCQKFSGKRRKRRRHKNRTTLQSVKPCGTTGTTETVETSIDGSNTSEKLSRNKKRKAKKKAKKVKENTTEYVYKDCCLTKQNIL